MLLIYLVELSLLRPQLALNIPFVLYLLLTFKEMLSPLKKINTSQQKVDKQLMLVDDQDTEEHDTEEQEQSIEEHSPKDKEVTKKQRSIKFIAKIIEPQLLLMTIHDVNKTADSLVVEVCG